MRRHTKRWGTSLRLLLIDDHPLFVEGFAAMVTRLRPDWQFDCASTGAAALASFAEPAAPAAMCPDVVVLDVFLPDSDGFDLVGQIKSLQPALPIILVSGRDHATMAVRAKASAANGFVAKTTPPSQFVELIETVHGGQNIWPGSERVDDTPTLTPRQAEVLDLLAAGHGNKEIRHRLGIAERTVRAHLTELFVLLGVHGRMPAVIRARELGLIE
jgi:DNA-binding NarL/FixJ family response regulator